MIKIELTNASNGIIKKVIDTQFNGADQVGEITTLYEIDEEIFEPDYYYERVSEFLTDLSKDLAINIGSDYSSSQLKIHRNWGDKYLPTVDELDEHLKNLRSEMKRWREYKKFLESNNVDNG